MRKLIVSTFLTLDGVMQAPGGPGEDDSGGFAHGGWSVNYWDDQLGQFMGEAMSTPFDLVLGRKTYDILAACLGGSRRQAIERRYQVRRVAESSHAGVEQLGPDRGRCGRRYRGAQAGRRAGAAGAWQREPDPDAVAPQPCRPVPPVGLPPRHWVGQAPVLGRHHPLRAEACRQQGLHYWSRDRYVRAGRRDRHRIVRAGLTALGITRRAISTHSIFILETHH